MHRNISSKSGLLILVIIASVAALVLVLAANRTKMNIQKSHDSIAISQKNISRLATVSQKKDLEEKSADWKLLFGNPDDICSIPVYEGRARIRGWYVYDYGYGNEKEWLLRIADSDKNKLPLFKVNQEKENFHLKVKLAETSSQLEEELKKASEDNPVEIEVSRYLTYCDGVSIASIRSAENL